MYIIIITDKWLENWQAARQSHLWSTFLCLFLLWASHVLMVLLNDQCCQYIQLLDTQWIAATLSLFLCHLHAVLHGTLWTKYRWTRHWKHKEMYLNYLQIIICRANSHRHVYNISFWITVIDKYKFVQNVTRGNIATLLESDSRKKPGNILREPIDVTQ